MDHETPLSHLGTTMEHLLQHWATQSKETSARGERDAAQAFTIAISREAGTLGTVVAHEVGRRLGWQVYDHELLDRIGQAMHVRAALLESVDERHQGWFTESIEGLLSMYQGSEWSSLVSQSAFVRHLVETVMALGVHGECVIIGRGAPFILPAASTLRVRLVGPIGERVAILARKLGIPEKEAARRVRTIDRQRIDFVQDHFLKNPADPRQYDLVLNATRLPIAAQVDLIVESLHHLSGLTAVKERALPA